jgi:uncharacterized membrane protein HdeD (DUF308 family)
LSAILGVVGLIAGLICIRRPGESVLALVLVLGVYLVVSGVVHLVIALGHAEHRGLGLLSAAAELVFGILILALPKVSVTTLAVLFGISLIIRGAAACAGALMLRRLPHTGADVAGSAGVGAPA